MNQIVITEKQQNTINVDTKFRDGVPLEKVLNMLLTAVLVILNGALEKAPRKNAQQVKAMLYDMANQKMTAVLEKFAPDIEMRPSITAEALLKMENEVLASKMPKM